MKTISRERRATVNYGKLSEDQIRKLRQDLEIAGGNLDIFNELLTELTPGEVSYTALYGHTQSRSNSFVTGTSRGQETS